MSRENPRTEEWAAYYANHPEVLANWGESNGYANNCPCIKCDPDQLQPRPNILEGA